MILLWMNVAGYPLKVEKASGGKEVEWVGATLEVNDAKSEVKVSIPKKKVEILQETTSKFLKRPVVGPRELRSFAGSLAFIAGLVPHLRPFLSSIWAALTSCGGPANDGSRKTTGKLVHTKRIKAALHWIDALLGGTPAPLVRTLDIKSYNITAEIVTDACPFGIGGVLRINHSVSEYFSAPLSDSLLAKFRAKAGESKFNSLWEAVALLVGTRLWLRKLNFGATVRIKSDNLSALRMIVRGRAKSPDLNIVAREFAIDLALREYKIHWVMHWHIPGTTNMEADALSRAFAPFPKPKPASVQGAKECHVNLENDFWKVMDLS